MLSDPRARLFLSDSHPLELDRLLEETTPLFTMDDFYSFDICLNGDDYQDPDYRARFSRILCALRMHETLKIHYASPKSEHPSVADYLPCKLEYSQKDDKFRLYAARIFYGKVCGIQIINLSRIQKIESSRQIVHSRVNLDDWLRKNHCTEPIQLRIFRKRNALERCMLHFASYEKRTEYEPETDSFLCSIYYDEHDETELLIRILSFGPVVQVLGPPAFLRQVRARVFRQHQLLLGIDA